MNTDKPIIKTLSGRELSPYFKCIAPLLDSLGWHGPKNTLYEAMPYDSTENFDINTLLSTLANLQFESKILNLPITSISEKSLPCVFIGSADQIFVLIRKIESSFLVYNCVSSEYCRLDSYNAKGKCIFISRNTLNQTTADDKQDKWFKNTISRFNRLFGIVLVISLATTVLALLQPTFITALFSQISPGNSYKPLIYLSIGVILYLAATEVLSSLRFDILNYISSRVGYIIDNQILRRILYLSLGFTEKATLSSQLSRIKDFQSIQKFICGKAALSLFELPFLIILIAALFVIGGFIGFIPIAGMIIFAIFGVTINGFVTSINSSTSQISAKKQDLTLEILNNIEAIKDSNSEGIWLSRYAEFSSKTVKTALSSERINAFINHFSTLVVSLSGMATIVAGTVMVIQGNMSSGALIASMLLTWRILAPLKTSFSTITQINKLSKSISQVDRLMNLNVEVNPVSSINLEKPFSGKVTFNQVSLRYQPDRDPALVGVNFSINPKEIVLIRGSAGAGKSTILKLLDGLYMPQAGSVLIDDFNIKQITPILLRKSISLIPQTADIFNGTIAQNLRLSCQNAKDEELIEAVKLANVYDDITGLENGINTILDKRFLRNFREAFLKKICFARALLRKSSILAIDEIDSFFTDEELSKFIRSLKTLKKDKTILIVSNNKNLITVSDKVLEMNAGKLTFFDVKSKYKING